MNSKCGVFPILSNVKYTGKTSFDDRLPLYIHVKNVKPVDKTRQNLTNMNYTTKHISRKQCTLCLNIKLVLGWT